MIQDVPSEENEIGFKSIWLPEVESWEFSKVSQHEKF